MTADLFSKAKSKNKKEDMSKLMDAVMAFTASAQAIHDRIANLEKHVAYLLSKDPSWVAAYENQQDSNATESSNS
jgi:hypothetical protein